MVLVPAQVNSNRMTAASWQTLEVINVDYFRCTETLLNLYSFIVSMPVLACKSLDVDCFFLYWYGLTTGLGFMPTKYQFLLKRQHVLSGLKNHPPTLASPLVSWTPA